MAVNEQVMALGDWRVTLNPTTPKTVRDLIKPMSHIVVTPSQLDSRVLADSTILTAARYTGVILQPGPQYQIGGSGLVWWLGDDSPKGPLLTAAVSGTNSFATWIGNLRPAALSAGTVSAVGSNQTASFQWVTNRQAIDTICSLYNAEYRISPDFKLNAGTIANLYGSAPTAVAVRKGEEGFDPILVGIESDMAVQVDYQDYTTEVYAIGGQGGRGSAGGASASFYDPQGTLLRRTRIVESPDAAPGTESTVAGNVLNFWSSDSGRRGITISTSRYDVTGDIKVGAYLYLYDETLGLVDTTNKVMFRGRYIYPQLVRVMAVNWPIREGMGVYCRWYSGGTLQPYVDLTPYVMFESGSASVEVAVIRKLSSSPSVGTQTRTQTNAGAWATYTPSWTTGGTAPTLGNGLINGSYRRDGTTLYVRGRLQIGSTSAVGTGEARVSLPSGVTTPTDFGQTLSAQWFDSSASVVIRGTAIAEPNKTYVNFLFADNTVRFASSSLGASDEILFTGTIEVQP